MRRLLIKCGKVLRIMKIKINSQWGLTSTPSSYSTTASFSIYFSNANYVIIGTGLQVDADSTKYYALNVRSNVNKTIANCYFRTSEISSPSAYYLAVGY